MASEPQMLFGLSPDSETPVAIPRNVAEDIMAHSPALAMALGITSEALRTGALGPATASPQDFPEIRSMGARVLPEDVPRPVLRTLQRRRMAARNVVLPTMGPRDALALHGELRASLGRDGMHKWLGAWLTEYDTKAHSHIDEIPAWVEETGKQFAVPLREVLRTAETYLVAGEANALITAAAEGLPWTMACEETTPPSPDGFLVFATPYEISDEAGNVMRLRAVSWYSGVVPSRDDPSVHTSTQAVGWPAASDDGILLSFWSEQAAHPANSMREARTVREVRRRLGTDLYLAQALVLPVGVPLQEWPMFATLLERGEAEGVVGPIAAIMATWMLMKQPIITTGRPALPPRIRKEIRQQTRIRADISVINLRQRPPSPERLPAEGEAVRREYHFRWTVRGHWRHQPKGPGRKEREWIYIWAHVKGPADKPLVQRRRVYRVSGRL